MLSSSAAGCLLAAALLAASCAGTGQQKAQSPQGPSAGVAAAGPEQDPDGLDPDEEPAAAGQPPSAGETTGAGLAVVLPSTLTETPMEEINRLFAEIAGYDIGAIADCMTDAGYPQYEEAASEREARGDLFPEPTSRNPMQIAPHTDQQARSHGMIGIRNLWPPIWADPEVRTNDRGYLAAAESCGWEGVPEWERTLMRTLDHQAVDAVLQEVSDLGSARRDLRNELKEAFAAATVQPLTDLLREQLACVSHSGYPQLDAAAAPLTVYDPMQPPPWETILPGAGVEIAPDLPPDPYLGPFHGPFSDNSDPPAEGIYVVRLSDLKGPAYVPPAAEIDFALTWVQCGQELGVMERFEQLQHEARIPILVQYETPILDLRQELEDLLARISQL